MYRWLAVVLVAAVIGCGGADAGQVSGVVTLDGDPLANATVTFHPQQADGESAPISQGTTDANGKYTLTLISTGETGAVIGKHDVSIEVFEDAEDEDDQADVNEDIEDKPNIVPARYNVDSELTFEVKGGSNSADWPLETN